MPHGRWLDPSQPQTLQNAVVLSYVFAAFGILYLITGSLPGLVALVDLLAAVGAYGIANDRRWGYRLDVGAASANLVIYLLFLVFAFGLFTLISVLFAAVLLGLLLHPQSREYERIWFH